MSKNVYAPGFDDLPETISVFPLGGVLLLPFGQLPLNIFEQRYLDMVNDALASHRLIGMVQPRPGSNPDTPALYDIGCAGKITEFSETEDGRYQIQLTGICRFRIEKEIPATTKYRQAAPSWDGFREDLETIACLDLDRSDLHALLKKYFALQDMDCDWGRVEEATDGRLITCLSMICPFSAKEQQALLEANCCKTRAGIFMTMLEMAIHDIESCKSSDQH